ncbi:hypothetical protein A0H81_06705 [Grifola frondosa]|uniref:Uncharacterized protein n=1 Tax=Grifola frondosa TaxID=5627 RepID=A0A1C7MD12_GRIFR|nr:hypothetical protein A0H81_06705 [Grifola frondosa]
MPIKPNSRGSGAAAGGAAKTAPSDASRIQSSQAKAGNDTSKGSFPARAQAAAARNTNAPPPAQRRAERPEARPPRSLCLIRNEQHGGEYEGHNFSNDLPREPPEGTTRDAGILLPVGFNSRGCDKASCPSSPTNQAANMEFNINVKVPAGAIVAAQKKSPVATKPVNKKAVAFASPPLGSTVPLAAANKATTQANKAGAAGRAHAPKPLQPAVQFSGVIQPRTAAPPRISAPSRPAQTSSAPARGRMSGAPARPQAVQITKTVTTVTTTTVPSQTQVKRSTGGMRTSAAGKNTRITHVR